MEAFITAYATVGYVRVDSPSLDVGVEKVALYVGPDQSPAHAARQLDNGRWISKLGPGMDIEHELKWLEGEQYGLVAAILARRRT